MRWPGFEPGSQAWKARMLTITLPTLNINKKKDKFIKLTKKKEKKLIE